MSLYSIPRWVVFLPLGWYVLYPSYLTLAQWYAWSHNSFTQILLASPLSPNVPFPSWFEFTRPLFEHAGGYFAFYSLGRFWTPAILSVLAALIWWGMLRLTRVAKLTVFSEEDTTLALVAALIVGWPRIIVFVPLVVMFAFFSTLFHTLKGTVSTSLSTALVLAMFGALVSTLVFPLMI